MEAFFELHGSAVVCRISGRIEPDDIGGLSDRLLATLERSGAPLIICDVGALAHVDATVVDALARLQLVAGRRGSEVRLRRARPDVLELLDLSGLAGRVPVYEA
jgi:anti-anti-sigma regulatory factor